MTTAHQDNMFTKQQDALTNRSMSYWQAATKYCKHDYRINRAIGWPPIYVYSDTCQICGMPKLKSNSSGE